MCVSSHKGPILLGAVPVLCLTFWESKAKKNMVNSLATSLSEAVSFRGSDCPSHWCMSGIPLPWSWQKSLLWGEEPRPLQFVGLLPESVNCCSTSDQVMSDMKAMGAAICRPCHPLSM